MTGGNMLVGHDDDDDDDDDDGDDGDDGNDDEQNEWKECVVSPAGWLTHRCQTWGWSFSSLGMIATK